MGEGHVPGAGSSTTAAMSEPVGIHGGLHVAAVADTRSRDAGVARYPGVPRALGDHDRLGASRRHTPAPARIEAPPPKRRVASRRPRHVADVAGTVREIAARRVTDVLDLRSALE